MYLEFLRLAVRRAKSEIRKPHNPTMKKLFAAAGACLGLITLFGPLSALGQVDETPPAILSHSVSELVGKANGNVLTLRVSILFNEQVDENSVIDPGQ